MSNQEEKQFATQNEATEEASCQHGACKNENPCARCQTGNNNKEDAENERAITKLIDTHTMCNPTMRPAIIRRRYTPITPQERRGVEIHEAVFDFDLTVEDNEDTLENLMAVDNAIAAELRAAGKEWVESEPATCFEEVYIAGMRHAMWTMEEELNFSVRQENDENHYIYEMIRVVDSEARSLEEKYGLKREMPKL